MTQADLAVKLNVTDKAVSRWERGIGFPDISTIEPLASALEISVLELMKSERITTDEVTKEEAMEIVTDTLSVAKQLRRKDTACRVEMAAEDIHPTDAAPILAASGSGIACLWQRWGFPGFKKGQVVFNARCESALEKPMFREGILHCRAVIPAAGFYEWDHGRRKHIFYRDGNPVLYLAGCYRKYGDGDRFVILTTRANASMEPVHDRMPLILEREEAAAWLLEDDVAEDFLRKTPPMLECRAADGQMSLFDL